MNDKAKLEPTAAMVMDLAKKFYDQDPLTSKFMERLDTSSAQVMIDAHRTAEIYDLTQELICNRKFIIRQAVLDIIRAKGTNYQVLILAAGKAPLALELLSREYDRISKVYEVDVSPFDEKGAIYKGIAPELTPKIMFHQGDIRSPRLLRELEAKGFDPSLNTIIIVEGTTHYMTPDELKQMLENLCSIRVGKDYVVIDYGPPFDTIDPRVQPMAREAYRIIEDNCYKQPMTKHTVDGLTQVFRSLGGGVLHHYTIHDIEKLRLGHNEFFPEKKSGWLEYIVARV